MGGGAGEGERRWRGIIRRSQSCPLHPSCPNGDDDDDDNDDDDDDDSYERRPSSTMILASYHRPRTTFIIAPRIVVPAATPSSSWGCVVVLVFFRGKWGGGGGGGGGEGCRGGTRASSKRGVAASASVPSPSLARRSRQINVCPLPHPDLKTTKTLPHLPARSPPRRRPIPAPPSTCHPTAHRIINILSGRGQGERITTTRCNRNHGRVQEEEVPRQGQILST